MTIINPKSISGITSITTASGADNLLTVHTNNTTERVRINNDGDVIVGSGITVSPDGDIFATGVTTATTFSGSGANLTNLPAANITGTLPAISGANLTNLDASDLASGTVPTARLGSGTASSSTFLAGDSTYKTVTGTTINNNADNRLITGSGSANTLEGEAGLTYDGSTTVKISGSGQQQLLLGSTNAGGAIIVLDGDSNGDGAGGDYSFIRHNTDGDIEIFARSTGGATNTIFKQSTSEKLRIQSGGGISFNGDTAAANALDDYEEGTYSPTFTSSGATFVYNHQYGYYTRVGDTVHVTFYITLSGTNSSGLSSNSIVINLPFTANGSLTRFEAGVAFGMIYKINLEGFGNPRGTVYQGNSYISILYAADNDTGGSYGSNRFDLSGCGISGSVTYKV